MCICYKISLWSNTSQLNRWNLKSLQFIANVKHIERLLELVDIDLCAFSHIEKKIAQQKNGGDEVAVLTTTATAQKKWFEY